MEETLISSISAQIRSNLKLVISSTISLEYDNGITRVCMSSHFKSNLTRLAKKKGIKRKFNEGTTTPIFFHIIAKVKFVA
jgi:hypothetical protein